jgi:NADPH2:quinone reductase
MQAVVIADGRLGLEERPDPAPGDGELLVAVRAAGVNAADLAQLRGRYPAPPGSPQDIPGLELAGEVVAAGTRVERFAVGDHVIGLVGGGAQATLAVVDQEHALPMPPGLPWPEAGGFAEAFFTAHDALFTQAGLTLGERLLVSGAAGGVGTAALQLAAAAGARVVAAVRDPSLREEVAGLGAALVVDPAEVEHHGPYDVLLELVGAPSLTPALRALATGARVVVIGVGASSGVEVDLQLLMRARALLRGSTLRARSRAEKAAVTAAVERHVLPLLAAGGVKVPVSAAMPLADAARAYERFARPGKLGKIVLLTG